jgi:hypothetical protein
MFIGVALRAGLLAADIRRGPPFGWMTLGAAQRGVFTLERKRAPAVRFHVEARGLEAGLHVTGRAIRPCLSVGKLPAMLVLVTIAAALVRDRLVEVRALVTSRTCSRCVLALKREARQLVIKIRFRPAILPSAGVMTGLARPAKLHLLERAAVRIGVTALATRVCDALKYERHFSIAFRVALHATDGLMAPGERKRCRRVVESGGGLPCFLCVAARTIGAEFAVVAILVTRGAFSPKAQVRVVRIFHFDGSPRFGRQMLRVVTSRAPLLPVLTFQREAGLCRMIEALRIESHQ